MPHQFITCFIPRLIGAGLLLAGGPVAAKEYAIELVVFDRPAERAAGAGEQWDFSSERVTGRLAEMAALIRRASEYETADEVVSLEPVRLNLIESGYRILDTIRWRQPTSRYRDAPLIALGDPETDLLAGVVRVYTTTLIYADLHLQLTQPPPQAEDFILGDVHWTASPDAPPARAHYFIEEKRRLQFKQIHYFDHPLFGAILGVWRVDDSLGV